MNETTETTKTQTAVTVVKTTVAVTAVAICAVQASRGLYDLTKDWSKVIKENRRNKKAQQN